MGTFSGARGRLNPVGWSVSEVVPRRISWDHDRQLEVRFHYSLQRGAVVVTGNPLLLSPLEAFCENALHSRHLVCNEHGRWAVRTDTM